MNAKRRFLQTRSGKVPLPAYVPVTTFGEKYPLDRLIGPYLPRLAPAVMVSFHYAQQISNSLKLPIFVDSGGFASLFAGSQIEREGELGILCVATESGMERVHPLEVLDLQERIADVAFTLDFPIPPGLDLSEAARRQELTIANAHWALANRRRRDLLLFACVQSWDAESARRSAGAYKDAGFDGLAIGGLVPRARDWFVVREIVEAVLKEAGNLPVHVFGLGKPQLADLLFQLGVSSVDSSSYVKLAAEGKLWSNPEVTISDPSPVERLHLALCNLATATKTALPLTASEVVFRTSSLAWRDSETVEKLNKKATDNEGFHQSPDRYGSGNDGPFD